MVQEALLFLLFGGTIVSLLSVPAIVLDEDLGWLMQRVGGSMLFAFFIVVLLVLASSVVI